LAKEHPSLRGNGRNNGQDGPGAVALGLGNRGVKIFAFPLIFLFAVVAGALFVNAFGPGLGPRQ